MRLFIVRHGETVENRKSICQGWKGGTLTRKGIAQAKKLARKLSKEKIDIIYCSDLKRTKDTCKEIKKYHPKTKLVYVKELRERCRGIFEGKPHSESVAFFKEKGWDPWKVAPPGGETFAQKDRRALRFYRKMIKQHPDETVVWVTHEGIRYAVLREVLGLSEEKKKILNLGRTSISIIEVDKKRKHTACIVD